MSNQQIACYILSKHRVRLHFCSI